MKRIPFTALGRGARVEQSVYAFLGLASLAMVLLCVVNAVRFSSSREAIATALEMPPSAVVAATPALRSTNLTKVERRGGDERTRLGQYPVPKS